MMNDFIVREETGEDVPIDGSGQDNIVDTGTVDDLPLGEEQQEQQQVGIAETVDYSLQFETVISNQLQLIEFEKITQENYLQHQKNMQDIYNILVVICVCICILIGMKFLNKFMS